MECRGYGPCLVSGVEGGAQAVDMLYEASKCEAVSAVEVLRRTCGGMEIDERLYRTARKRFEALVGSSVTPARVALLREAGVDLAARADAQKARPLNELEALSGNKLQRRYEISSGGGVPWRVNEYDGWYLAHERARFSCERCSGDVVPEKVSRRAAQPISHPSTFTPQPSPLMPGPSPLTPHTSHLTPQTLTPHSSPLRHP